jgi:hypothetical protein
MRPHIVVVALLISSPAVAADEQQSVSPSPYAELNKQVQEKLRAESFYNGPINGDFGYYTQAALAQFQLSRALPASGTLDATTLAAMGLEQDAERPAEASADTATADTQARNARRCDDLMGQEKEQCLQQGGIIEASAQSGSGASGPAR